MFLGKYFHTIDDKGRVAIPHKFRTHLGGSNEGRVVITLSPRTDLSYLDIYPADRWEKILEQILETQIQGENPQEVQEAVLANYIHPAQEAALDKQGRILLPQEHREAAEIKKDVVYTGDIRKFRLWARDHWERYNERASRSKDKIKDLKGIWL
jgi:MraZ protein